MAVADSTKVDYLYKKLGFGVTKTAPNADKQAFNESIPSPLLMRGDKVWQSSGSIPSVKPSSTTSIVRVYQDAAGGSPTRSPNQRAGRHLNRSSGCLRLTKPGRHPRSDDAGRWRPERLGLQGPAPQHRRAGQPSGWPGARWPRSGNDGETTTSRQYI